MDLRVMKRVHFKMLGFMDFKKLHSLLNYFFINICSRCNTTKDICSTLPCINGGTCQPISDIRRKCICQPGYAGTYCQDDIGKPFQYMYNLCMSSGMQLTFNS